MSELKRNEDYKFRDAKLEREELKLFYYRVMHDIKSPVISIISLVKLTKAKIKNKKTQVLFEEIENHFRLLETEITSSLKNGLLFSDNLGTDQVDFTSTLNEVIHLLLYSRNMETIHFHTQIDQKEKFRVNRQLVFSILQNIIDNSIKHGRNSDEQELNIRIGIKQFKKSIKIKIADDGIGIPDSTVKKVFDRLGSDNNLLTKGNGLGLYIIKKCVDKLNGQLSIHNKKNGGTVFEISIPECF